MKTTVFHSAARRCLIALTGAAALATTLTLSEATVEAQNPRIRTTAASPTQTYSRQEAEAIASRLHRALFNSESGSMNDTINEVQAGRVRQRVDALVAVPEFRQRVMPQGAGTVVGQIYRGLLDRDPTDAELRRDVGFVSKGRVSDVVVTLVTSGEFQSKVRSGSGSGGSGSTASVDAGTAANCMEQVVEAVRNDLPGIVLLRFESAERDGNAVKGIAIDAIDNNRRISYRCDGGASYNYEDGRRDRSGPAEGSFPSERVTACQNDIRSRVQSQRQGDITFESAGIISTSSGDQVRGLGFEKKQGGQNFTYRCQMDGSRVANASFNWR